MSMTVRQALEIAPFSTCTMLAGQAGLERMVTSVTVLDAPDSAPWLKPAELILTTGYVFQGDPGHQRRLIYQLAERGCAGLAIKIRRFLHGAYHPICAAADQVGLPLIEIPPELSLSDLMLPLMRSLLERAGERSGYSRELQQQLMQAILEGRGFPAISAALHEVLGNPTVILGASGDVLGAGGIAPKSVRWRESSPILDGAGAPGLFIPIRSAGRIVAYLAVWPVNSPLTARDQYAAQEAVSLIALEMAKRLAVSEAEARVRGERLSELLLGRFPSPDLFTAAAHAAGLDPRRSYLCLVASPVPRDPGQRHGAVMRALTEHPPGDRTVLWTCMGDSICVVVGSEQARSARLRAYAAGLASALQGQLAGSTPGVEVGIGTSCHHLTDLPRSFQEALAAPRLGRARSGITPRPVHDFSLLRPQALLDSLPREALKQFVEQTVGVLLELRTGRNEQLLQTLEALLQTGGRIVDTASLLYLHRNTVQFRQRKLEEILGVDLSDPDVALQLRLGLMAYRLLQGLPEA